MCNTNRDLQVDLHKVLAGICQSVVSIFWSSTGAATIIINSPRQSPMFLMVVARCHQVFTKVSFLPVNNVFCSTGNSLQLIVANVSVCSLCSFFLDKKVLQPLSMFVWSTPQHILNFNLTIKVCTRWMRALWQVCEDCTIVIYAIPHKNLVCGLHSRWASWFIT